MRSFIKLGCLFLLCLSSHVFAGDTVKPRKQTTYKPGPSLSMHSAGGVDLGYYFLCNNRMYIGVYFKPYQGYTNYLYTQGRNTHSTTLGAYAQYFFPLYRSTLNNRLFFSLTAGWVESFGRALLVQQNNKLKYLWGVSGGVGFEYRLNERFYISIIDSVVYYASQLENYAGQQPAILKVFRLFSDASIKFTLKF